MYVYCVYPAMSNSPKQLQNCPEKSKIECRSSRFNGVLSHVRAFTVTIFHRRST
jgi:hypothetical protein